ncbi:NADH:ubiquinone reductase (Na(+)-transporting) subunit F [Martelella radicis]|uniref:Phenol hydroxylase P5 protein n=1 Tax=Martelella radicis TaxID=1397476 RepID=A0A7W6KFV2_9HYPH|nr:2Fe-2S iron-sulfur cluster binding domain-containing protein [Martelella radicis]MBB4120343.1 phenol hydroxylase P5 protein [Martelella radicis]
MAFRLTVEPIGETIDVREDQTILDACLRQGIWLPHACGHGLCGTCKVDVLEGEVDHADASSFALMDFEREDGKTLACCARLTEDVVIEAEIDEDEDAEHIPINDFTATVARIVDLTPDIKGIWLAIDGEPIRFQPGQYINLTIPGVEGPRAFSIASSPKDGATIELNVRKVPGGKATPLLHETLKEGDHLSFTGPYGQFFTRRSRGGTQIFIGGGSGLSSPKSMVLELLENGWDEPVYLFHGARGLKDLYYRDLFETLAAEHANFRYVPALSEPDLGDDWQGETGFIHEALQRAFPDGFADMTAYLCGPPPMIEATIRTLMRGFLFEEGIFTEKFLTAADEDRIKSPVFRRI